MILIIDNYDSFTYNLVQAVQSLGYETRVVYNDRLTPDEIRGMDPEAILLSPGPCTPREAGVCLDVVRLLHREYPIFGVCLGHQVIGEAFGSSIVRADHIMHGKVDTILHQGDPLFESIDPAFPATRYHSLVIRSDSLSEELEVIARSESDREIMAVRHKHYPVYGVQFHPESIATPDGLQMIRSFFTTIAKKGVAQS